MTFAFLKAGENFNTPIIPLPQEWWDFRMPADFVEAYAPVSENDLPPYMRLVGRAEPVSEDVRRSWEPAVMEISRKVEHAAQRMALSHAPRQHLPLTLADTVRTHYDTECKFESFLTEYRQNGPEEA